MSDGQFEAVQRFAVEYHALGNADELTFLDITASSESRQIMIDVVARTAEGVFMPLTVGGGIRQLEDIRAVLLAGADKVSINSAAVHRPELLSEGAERFGSQCIVLAIDAKRRTEGWWEVYVSGGRIATGLDALTWAQRAVEIGAGEILLASMDADGTMNGYDLALTHALAKAVAVPVIASGGAGRLEHFAAVLTTGGADAALAATLFHDGLLSVAEVKRYLLDRGLPIRPTPPSAGRWRSRQPQPASDTDGSLWT